MGLLKYYSLDECTDQDKVYEILNDLMADAKISYEEVDTDLIKIKDRGLTNSEIKSVLSKFSKYDVLEYTDLIGDDDEDYDDDDDYDDNNWED
jgi:hypothetical protein